MEIRNTCEYIQKNIESVGVEPTTSRVPHQRSPAELRPLLSGITVNSLIYNLVIAQTGWDSKDMRQCLK